MSECLREMLRTELEQRRASQRAAELRMGDLTAEDRKLFRALDQVVTLSDELDTLARRVRDTARLLSQSHNAPQAKGHFGELKKIQDALTNAAGLMDKADGGLGAIDNDIARMRP